MPRLPIANFRLAPILLVILATVESLFGQDATSANLDNLRQQLQEAIQGANLTKASEIAEKLDRGVQQQYRASLVRDARERVDEVLNWLPTDTESLFVLQYPSVLHAEHSPELAADGPARVYAFDRLMALNNGDIYRRLQGKTVRLVVAAMKNAKSETTGPSIVPAIMPDADVTYIYFFTEPVRPDLLGEPELSSNLGSVWRGSAKVDAGEPWTRGQRQRAQREDVSWLALPQPDLLVVCSRRETLDNLLRHFDKGYGQNSERAFPEQSLAWKLVDRKANLWAMRRYPDSAAKSLAVRFDLDSGDLEMRYMGGTGISPGLDRMMNGQFKTVSNQNGILQFESNTRERGDFPFHIALALLGFGRYR